MAKQHWFVSHPSGGHRSTPTFFRGLDIFGATNPDITIVLPHLDGDKLQLTKDDIGEADLVLAEVSVASTGSGIELGWANAAEKPIIAFHQGTSVMSPSVQFVATAIHAYITEEHITKILDTLT